MHTHRHIRRYVPALVFIMPILVGLACGGTAPQSQPRVSTATPTTLMAPDADAQETVATPVVPTATPTANVQEPLVTHLGDVVEQYGYSLSALTVEDPATRPGIFYEPEAGKKLVAVEFVVGNVSGETFSSNVLYTTLVDAGGFLYGAESSLVEGSLELLDVNPGERVRGWAGFVIPQDATPASLKYEFHGSGEVLQVGLTTE